MKVDVIIYGDQHYDLKTEGIDRTNDIDDAHNQIIDYAIDLKGKKRRVVVLNMGDMFHGTRPRSEVIATAIRTLRKLEEEGIQTYIVAGNHDVIDQQGRTSALEPILAIGFEFVNIVHDITRFEPYPGLNVICLPHISKAKAVSEGYKTAQEYIDAKSVEIEEEIDDDTKNIVIGHMNIAGAKTGTETYMIKGAHEDFPRVLKDSDKIDYIFNGHIHRPQIVPNPGGAPIIVTGDIQTNDFGERLDTKIFFHLELEV
jgi:DNA repair exonuclease SbcCD nuclease subunit